MSGVESDLFHLVNAIKGARVNWNDFHWRFHVEADVAAFDMEVHRQVQQNIIVFWNNYNQGMDIAWSKVLWSCNLLFTYLETMMVLAFWISGIRSHLSMEACSTMI